MIPVLAYKFYLIDCQPSLADKVSYNILMTLGKSIINCYIIIFRYVWRDVKLVWNQNNLAVLWGHHHLEDHEDLWDPVMPLPIK